MNRPFLLKPVGKDYLWGGDRLKEEFNKDMAMTPLAESWECSVHPDGLSTIESGEYKGFTLKEILEKHPEYLGKKFMGQSELQLLVKLIDAKKDLSIQVHPNDEYAMKYENGQRGKTEMWYVLEAKKGASIFFGFGNECTAEAVRRAIDQKTITNYLQRISVKKGDVFFIEPGTVHAIGKGCVIAEVQESSNLTYRLFDYDRTDKNGEKRELHLEKAFDVIDLSYKKEPKQPLRVLKYKKGIASEFLARCKYFETYRILLNTIGEERITETTDGLCFRIFLCVEGEGKIECDGDEILFKKGQCIFVPAGSGKMILSGRAEILDIRG